MSEAKHTPGPWLLENDDPALGIIYVRDADGLRVQLADIDADTPEEVAGNTRAIAKVPDMIGLLECAVRVMDGHYHDVCQCVGCRARRLLAEVKGGGE